MSTGRRKLDIRSEIIKLERLLGSGRSSLTYLESVPPEELRRLTEQATDAIFDADRASIQRLLGASRLLPGGLTAKLAQNVFGPLLSARIADQLAADQAVDLAKRLDPSFLADIAIELDPRRASGVLGRMPGSLIAAIATELVKRGAFVTMGRMVGHLPDRAVKSAIGVIDAEALLRTAFFVEETDRLNAIVDMLDDQRLDDLIVAAGEVDLWPEVLDLVEGLTKRRQGRVADAAAAHDDELLAGLFKTAHEQQLWDFVLPLVGSMSKESRERFATLKTIQRKTVLREIVAAAARTELWAELLPLVPLLTPKARGYVAGAVAELDRDVIERAIADTGSNGISAPGLVAIAAAMDPKAQAELATLFEQRLGKPVGD